MIRTTFFTCCNKKYQEFVPFFASSILKNNPDSVVEVGVEDMIHSDNFQSSIKYIKDLYGDRFFLREVKFDIININGKSFRTCPNVIRFIEEPILKSRYIYIGDVDIITLENDITNIHLDHMSKTGLNYSNIIRPIRENEIYKRMTGLHFSKWDNYYPIGDFENLAEKSLLSLDEVFLHEIVSSKNDTIESDIFRPVHGIHISPNRDIHGWGVGKWLDKWMIYRNSEEFKILEKLTSDEIKDNFKKIDNFK